LSKFNNFEDIVSWQKARDLVNEVYNSIEAQKFNNDFTLINQIKRASISIMLNIAEGFGRKTDKEFKQFLIIAHGSVSEVQSALYIALDRNYIDKHRFKLMYSKCSEISKTIVGLIKYLNY